MGAKRVRRKKLNLIKMLLIFLCLYLLGYGTYYLVKLPIRNIYVLNNKILNDQEILETAKIDNYPSFFLTFSNSIRDKLLKNPYIKDVKIKKKWFGEIDLYITEHKILYRDKTSNIFVLENKVKVPYKDNINSVPTLLNYVPDTIYKKFLSKLSSTSDSVKIKISEIEYKPIEVDKERFLLSMNDGNYVYLTLYKFEQINKYNQILSTLENKKGILYLDSGNYFEIFK